MPKLRVYDRSRVVADWKCPRERFWRYEYKGKGIVHGNTHLELFLGTTIHDALATIAGNYRDTRDVDIDAIATAARDQVLNSLLPQTAGEIDDRNFAVEQAALIEGLVRGFYRTVWPNLIGQYPQILFIEEEMRFDHNGLTFMSKPDLVLANDEVVVYVEYKSTKSKKEEWIHSWNTAIQLHSTCKAIEATKGQKVDYVVVQGLYKGYESYGKQSSPFCYAYKRNGTPPFSKDEIVYEYRAGFKRYPTWELEGGVKKWVEEMPMNVLMNQFPQTPPIMIKDDMVDTFFLQRSFRENEIKMAMQMVEVSEDPEAISGIIDVAFPQKFDQCFPAWGKPCSYRQLCHGYVEDPLEQGYSVRESHHALETELWNSNVEGERSDV